MKTLYRSLFVLLVATTTAFASDFFFYHGKDSDVPLAVRWVRVARIVLSLAGKPKLEGTTDADGIAKFPKLEVARVESVRCEVSAIGGSTYAMNIAADPRAIAWPVIFHLRPIMNE